MYMKIILVACVTFVYGDYENSLKPTIKTKRQLYREQLLPSRGGKIPDSAFQVDRLALNRLNKEGISIPDGILFEQRHRESHYQDHRSDPDIARSIVRLKQTPDGRYTPSEGRYPSFENEIESTYLIRPPYEGSHNLVLPPYRPNPGGSFQVPAKLPYSKLFKDRNPMYRDRLNHNSIYPDYQEWSSSIWGSYVPEIFFNGLGYETERNRGYIPDFPSLTEIPATSFICDRSGRMYPDPEAKCQAFHLCHYNGKKETFLCPPGTRFEPLNNECTPWYKVACVPLV